MYNTYLVKVITRVLDEFHSSELYKSIFNTVEQDNALLFEAIFVPFVLFLVPVIRTTI
jgi:hypothetical protein